MTVDTDTGKTLAETLEELREVSGTVAALEPRRTELVVMARALGANWPTIGEAMGVTKQAAWERYVDRVNNG